MKFSHLPLELKKNTFETVAQNLHSIVNNCLSSYKYLFHDNNSFSGFKFLFLENFISASELEFHSALSSHNFSIALRKLVFFLI